jgi:hypothetical protein
VAACVIFGAGMTTSPSSTVTAPTIVLYDLSVPYSPNWDYLEVLRLLPETQGTPFVITTGNKVALEKVVGATNAIEIIRTAQSLTEVTEAIRVAHIS